MQQAETADYGGNCRVDSDCGAGGFCSFSSDGAKCGIFGMNPGYFCHTPNDACTDDDECSRQNNHPYTRQFTGSLWQCSSSGP